MVMKKILYLDMDGVLVDFASALEQCSAEVLRQYEGDYDHIPNLFGKMLPVPGALEAVDLLADWFDLYVLSTAPWENPSAWIDKLLWVKRYLPNIAYKRLILSHNKHLNRGDFLVDDRDRNGADRFEGELLRFGSERFPDWAAVVAYLKERR